MNNRKRIALILAAVTTVICTLVALIALLPANREPRYQGKPLSYWLWQPNLSDFGDGDGSFIVKLAPAPGLYRENRIPSLPAPSRAGLTWKQREALEAAGTNAIPSLLRMLRAKDSHLKLVVVSLAQKQRYIKISFTPAAVLNFRGHEGLRLLGSEASNAIPALIKICDERISPTSRLDALDALGWFGPAGSNAVPALLRAVSDTNSLGPVAATWPRPGYAKDAPYRITALWSLEQIHARPELVMPVIFDVIQHGDPASQLQAISTLYGYGPEAQAAVQPFLPVIRDLNPSIQWFAVTGLRSIDREAANSMPVDRSSRLAKVKEMERQYLTSPSNNSASPTQR